MDQAEYRVGMAECPRPNDLKTTDLQRAKQSAVNKSGIDFGTVYAVWDEDANVLALAFEGELFRKG